MVMVAGVAGVIVALVNVSEPLHAVAPSKASKTAEPSVTLAVPLSIFGFRIPAPEAGIIRSSGFKYHSEAGLEGWVPLTTSSVMLYGAKVCVVLQLVEVDAVMVPGLVEATVYAVLPGSLFRTIIVIVVPVASSAA